MSESSEEPAGVDETKESATETVPEQKLDDAVRRTSEDSEAAEPQVQDESDPNVSAGTVNTRWKRKATAPQSRSCYPNLIPNTYNSAGQTLASPISEIRPYLFISGYGSLSAKKLKELGVTHVVDATNIPNRHGKDVEHLEVSVSDNEREDISKHFQSVADFIRSGKDKGGKVVVFSGAGKSRSAVLCMIYLVIHEGLTLKEAFFEVARARPIILPNLGFWRQMIKFEADRRDGKSSVELLKGMAKAVPDVYLQRRQVGAQKC